MINQHHLAFDHLEGGISIHIAFDEPDSYVWPMLGTFLNAGAIIGGGIAGLVLTRQISPVTEARLKIFIGTVVSYVGVTTTWSAVNGRFGQVIKQIFIAMLALVIGNLIGRILGLQAKLNRAGALARSKMAAADNVDGTRLAEGFVTCTLLFCIGPMAILGALQDGLNGNIRILAVKSIMDGLTTLAFVKTFGWGVMLSALPLFAYQGGITMAARNIEPFLHNQALLDSVNATGGLLILCIALVIFQIQKVPLANYLPSLAVAPFLTWLWR
jgi:uncharacterized membrane protein YqgA involved in biofilm formation